MTEPAVAAPAAPLAVPAKQHWVDRFVSEMRSTVSPHADAPSGAAAASVMLREVGGVVGDYATGAVIGGSLGAALARFGPSVAAKAAGAVAGVGALLGVFGKTAYPNAAAYARRAGASGFTALSLIKGYEWSSGAPLATRPIEASITGETPRFESKKVPTRVEEDPIARVAREIDL